MKAKELMIGDLLRVNRDGLCIKKDTIVQVREIDGNNKFEEKGLVGCANCRPLDKMQYEGGIWLNYLEPIPITPEILEKNGFINDFYEDISVADYHSIRVEGYSLHGKVDDWDDYLVSSCNGSVDVVTDFHGEVRKEMRYIHELQHALRLCGIDKEIEL